jgi:hypothetical protein
MIAAAELLEENQMQDMDYDENDFNDLCMRAELEAERMTGIPEVEIPPPDKQVFSVEEQTPEEAQPEQEQSEETTTLQVITSLIDSLTGDPLQDLSTLKNDIAPRIAATDGLTEDLLITKVKGKTGISKGVIRAEIQAARQSIEKITVMPENSIEEKLDEEIVARAEAFKKDPFLFRHIIDAAGRLGVAGERKTIGTIIVVIASRLIPKGFNSSEALALKIWGPYGIGDALVANLSIPLDELEHLWHKDLTSGKIWFYYLSTYLYAILFFLASVLAVIGFIRYQIRRRKSREKEE